MHRRNLALGAMSIAVVLLLSLPAVGAARQSEPEALALRAVQRIRMVDNAYRPRSISVPRGTRIRWINRGNLLHSATSTTGIWDSGLLDPGEAFTRVFRRAGTFRFKCTIHPTMRGRIVVT